LTPDAPNLLEVVHPGYANNDCSEDDARQQHLDAPDEAVGDRLKAGTVRGQKPISPNHDAENLHIKLAEISKFFRLCHALAPLLPGGS
jgi:hypothetical protein